MALLAAYAYFTFRDAKGKTATTEIKLPLGLDIPEYIDAAQKFGTILVNNTLARLTQVEVCVGLDVTVAATTAAAGSDVQEVRQFVFAADNGTNFILHIPTLDEDLVLAGTDALDITATPVAALLGFITTGNGVVVPVNVRDQDVQGLSYAREMFRRR